MFQGGIMRKGDNYLDTYREVFRKLFNTQNYGHQGTILGGEVFRKLFNTQNYGHQGTILGGRFYLSGVVRIVHNNLEGYIIIWRHNL
jgi:hypothetical protein